MRAKNNYDTVSKAGIQFFVMSSVGGHLVS